MLNLNISVVDSIIVLVYVFLTLFLGIWIGAEQRTFQGFWSVDVAYRGMRS